MDAIRLLIADDHTLFRDGLRALIGLQPAPSRVFPELTDREREILNLIAQGHNNAEIAQLLTLSPKTIRNYVSNILDKLQVADRAEAIVRAREAGLGQEKT